MSVVTGSTSGADAWGVDRVPPGSWEHPRRFERTFVQNGGAPLRGGRRSASARDIGTAQRRLDRIVAPITPVVEVTR